MLKKLLRVFSENKPACCLIVVGVVTWSLTMVKSGILYPFGLGFWGPNGHDGIWHIALINSLSSHSWSMPMFAGEQIKNYHVGFDLLVSIIRKLTHLPAVNLYFQIIPPILAALIGVVVFWFTYDWTKSKVSAFWATFFVYFGGGFGYLVSLYKTGKLGGESVFWAQQAISTLINPPFALSLIFIFLGLICLSKGLKTNDKRLFVLATFLFGVLVQIKVYAGLLVLAGLFVSGLYDLLSQRKSTVLKVFVGSLVVSILLFSDLSSGGNMIIFKPFWFVESLFASPDRFYWPRFAEALANYRLGNILVKGFVAYILATIIFIAGNFGTRLISIFWLAKKGLNHRRYTQIDLIVLTIVGSGIVLPLLFVQSGNSWNTIQFLYYSLLFSGILSGIWLGSVLTSKMGLVYKYLLVFGIVLFTVPTTIGTLVNDYLPARPPAMISNEELSALKFLKNQPDGVVLTLPFNKELADKAVDNPPRPLYLYESTAYVSAISGQQTYLEDEVNLEITNYNWRERRQDLEEYLTKMNKDFLVTNNITYLYFVGDTSFISGFSSLEELYSNSEVKIYRVD